MNLNPKELPIKKQIELYTAQRFLILFNTRFETSYKVVGINEAPYIECFDPISADKLFLEINLLEDWEGDNKHQLRKGDKRAASSTTGYPLIFFTTDTLPRLRVHLTNKLCTSYRELTALVISQFGILWIDWEWHGHAYRIRKEIFRGREENYGAGVWVLCNDKFGKNSIFSFTEYSLDELKRGTLREEVLRRAFSHRVAWEGYEPPSFLEFSNREGVDAPIRVESPHGCDEAVLIAFNSYISKYPHKVIASYRSEMDLCCLCGKYKFPAEE